MIALKALCILVCCQRSIADYGLDDSVQNQVTLLEPGTIVDYQPKTRRGFFNNDMRIYCYQGSPKALINFFESVELQLEIERDEFTQYEGATPTEVRKHFDERQSLFSFNLFTQKRSKLHISPFKQQCIGIDTELSYRVRLQQSRVDYFRLMQFGVGVAVFLFSGKLSHNSVFYYLTGVVLGICCSFMLLIWLCSKLMPRRPMMYGMMIGGWTLGFYVIQRLWENLHLIFQTYSTYVVWYIFITGILAFFFCYRIGPPKNQRSKNIIKWVLQIMAIILIYFSSHYEEASSTAAVVISLIHFFPYYILNKTRTIYRRFFPKQRRLLTIEEYHEQGVAETDKALNELRAFASSPDCKQWKMISKLRDPLRFASFVEGESHLREEETAVFESFIQANEIDESELSENEDEHIFEKSANTNFRYSHYEKETEQNRSNLIRKNVTYEEMSEHDNENEDISVTKGTIPKHDTLKASFDTEQNRKRIGLHHFYSPTKKYIDRAKDQNIQADQLPLLNPKMKLSKHITSGNNNKDRNRFQHDHLDKRELYYNGSESDDY